MKFIYFSHLLSLTSVRRCTVIVLIFFTINIAYCECKYVKIFITLNFLKFDPVAISRKSIKWIRTFSLDGIIKLLKIILHHYKESDPTET